jgi:hypothetical protein
LSEGVGDLDGLLVEVTGRGEVIREDTGGDTTRGIIETELGRLVDREKVGLVAETTTGTGGGDEKITGTGEGAGLTAARGRRGDETRAAFDSVGSSISG